MTKHTPGPWLARQYFSGHWEICENATAKRLATVDKSNPLDARLIASAPELLAALKCIIATLNQNATFPEDIKYCKRVATSAIAKAEGRD